MTEADRIQQCFQLVTEDDVNVTLKADKGIEAQLKKWEVEEFTKRGDNYASVVAAVKVEYVMEEKPAEISYIVKMNPCMSVMDDLTNLFFKKEAEAYTNFVPAMNKLLKECGEREIRVPQCYHYVLDASKELIFLEDLRQHGFKMADRKKGLDSSHGLLVLNELARFHAASIKMQQQNPDCYKDALVHKSWMSFGEMMTSWIGAAMGHVKSMLDTVKGYEDAANWMETSKEKLADLMKTVTGTKYTVLLHGDCWTNNLLFRYDENGTPVEVRLIDLQVNRTDSLAVDIGYHLYTSYSHLNRQPNFDKFIDSYLCEFKQTTEALGCNLTLDKDELMGEIRARLAQPAILASTAASALYSDSEDIPEMTNDDDTEKMVDDFGNVSLRLFESSKELRDRILAMFDEFRNYGLY